MTGATRAGGPSARDVPRRDATTLVARPARVDPSGSLRDLLTRQALAVERHRTAVARQLGLGEMEMNALRCLQQAGELTTGELRERLALSSGGTTALVQRLVRDGHVSRRPHRHDGRSTVLRATDATLATLTERSQPLLSALDDAAAGLSDDERATIAAWLDRIVAATEAEADDAGRATPPSTRVPSAWF